MVRLPSGIDLKELAVAQTKLARRVVRRDAFGRFASVRRVAGVDVTYEGERAIAAVVVLDRASLATVEEATAVRREAFPYVPGYLSFREMPAAMAAFARLRAKPDLVMVDAHGVLHPRDLGFASHFGVELGVPTIGVAKSLWVGVLERAPRRGAPAPIRWHGKVGGYAVLSGRARNPVYASIGHRVSARSAARWVEEMSLHRVPEPTRRAHVLAGRAAGRGA